MELADFPFPPIQDNHFPIEGPEFGPDLENLFLPDQIDLNMADAAALANAITNAFRNLRRDFAYPVPQFSGKKGEKPEDHCLKVEDWFAHFNIAEGNNDDQRVQKFKETLTGKPRQWYNSLNPLPNTWDGNNGLKTQFNTRWSIKGKTPDALYAEWQSLQFDPSKEDVEDFINDVQQIATQLGYPERAQVMAIKGCLPMDVHNSCLNIDALPDLKQFLIRVFDNPRMKKAYNKTEPAGAGTSAFSAFSATEGTSPDLGKLITKLDSLQLSLNSFSDKKPYKPQAAPRRFRNQNNQRQDRNRGRSNDRFQNRSRDQKRFKNNQGQRKGKFQGSPNVKRPRVASKTPNKDNMRCHYCQEIGHFIRECRRKKQDEKKATKYGMYTIPEELEGENEELSLFSDNDEDTDLNN